jgi:hypothetical protein
MVDEGSISFERTEEVCARGAGLQVDLHHMSALSATVAVDYVLAAHRVRVCGPPHRAPISVSETHIKCV